jgi:ketosteroid isomerase-like protein
MNEPVNLQVVQACYEAFNRRDIPFILSQLSDDVRWASQIDPAVPWSGVHIGPSAVGSGFFGRIAETAEIFDFQPIENLADGDSVVTLGSFGCRVHSTGETGRYRFVFIWKLQDGKVSSYEQFHEHGLGALFAETAKAVTHA